LCDVEPGIRRHGLEPVVSFKRRVDQRTVDVCDIHLRPLCEQKIHEGRPDLPESLHEHLESA
jgi:hypothetical protein